MSMLSGEGSDCFTTVAHDPVAADMGQLLHPTCRVLLLASAEKWDCKAGKKGMVMPFFYLCLHRKLNTGSNEQNAKQPSPRRIQAHSDY